MMKKLLIAACFVPALVGAEPRMPATTAPAVPTAPASVSAPASAGQASAAATIPKIVPAAANATPPAPKPRPLPAVTAPPAAVNAPAVLPMPPVLPAAAALTNIDCTGLRDKGANPESFSMAKPLRQDSRLVVFPYDKNAIYPINTYYNRFTHFEFEPSETVLGVYLNDETEWEQRVSATATDLFIRPRQRGVSGSVTVITARRRYQMDLIDVQGCGAPRYQRVSWFISDGVFEDRDALAQMGRAGQGNWVQGPQPTPTSAVSSPVAVQSSPAPAASKATWVDLQALNTRYSIEGDAELAPEQVMDDGQRTWLKFRAATSRRPVLFLVNPEGQAETVEYASEGSYFVIARLFPHGALLKDGKSEVRIRNQASSCGFFDSQCKSMKPKNVAEAR